MVILRRKSSASPKVVYVIRHGEAEHNVNAKLLKRCDTLLTIKGRRQAVTLRRKLTPLLRPDVVVTSPVLRALQTCKLLDFNNVKPIVVPDAREMAGWKANRPVKACRVTKGDLAAQFARFDWSLALRDASGPSGEAKYLQKEYQKRGDYKVRRRAHRMTRFIEKLPGTKVVLVSHGEFLMHLTGDSYMDNCEVRAYKLSLGCWRRSRLRVPKCMHARSLKVT